MLEHETININQGRAARRPGPWAVLGVILLAILPLLICLQWAGAQWAELQYTDPLAARLLRLALFGAPLALLALVGAIAWRRWGWAPSVQAHYQVEHTRALHQPGQLPQTLHQHITSTTPLAAPLSAPALLPAISDDTALALPDAAPLAAMLPRMAAGQLCYGLLPGGEPLVLTFGQAYHALAAGDTRTGKSNYLDSIITQLHHQAQHYDQRLLIGDFKREMAATWRRSPLVEAVEVDPAVIADMLIELAHGPDGILQRYSQFETIGNQAGRVIRNIGDYRKVTGERPRLTFCVIDELNALIEAADKKDGLASALKIVLQTGAGAGVYVLSGAQYLTARTFGRDGSKQFTTRAQFGAFDQTAVSMLFGAGRIDPAARALLTGAPGRGLIRTAGQALPTPFQALRCDEDDILGAIQLVSGTASTLEIPPRNAEPAEPLNRPRTASEPAEPAFSTAAISPDMAAVVRRLVNEGWSKTKVIETLFGVKRGGSAAYKELSAAYDQLVEG